MCHDMKHHHDMTPQNELSDIASRLTGADKAYWGMCSDPRFWWLLLIVLVSVSTTLSWSVGLMVPQIAKGVWIGLGFGLGIAAWYNERLCWASFKRGMLAVYRNPPVYTKMSMWVDDFVYDSMRAFARKMNGIVHMHTNTEKWGEVEVYLTGEHHALQELGFLYGLRYQIGDSAWQESE